MSPSKAATAINTRPASSGAIGCSGGTDSQDEVVSEAGAAVVNK